MDNPLGTMAERNTAYLLQKNIDTLEEEASELRTQVRNLKLRNDLLVRAKALHVEEIDTLKEEIAELGQALANKEAMALELVKQRNMALDDLAEAKAEVRIARKLLDKEKNR